jgi:hypothetical protein
VTIPSTIAGLPVTAIATNAFYNCWSLTNVTIGNNVKAIGDYAFEGCEGLTSLTIPNGVGSIGDSAFSQCTRLASVTIANSITNIGDFAFAACTSLTAITVAALNPVYSSLNGVLFDKGQTTLMQCPGGTTGSYAIPNTVTSILYSAFNGCARLTNIAIPNSVTSIGDNAFGGCTGLASVTIPDSVIHLGNGAFAGCSSLANATVGCNIAASAFAYCQSLTDVTIGQSVTIIGDSAFWYCTSLMGIHFNGTPPALVGGNMFWPDYGATIYFLPGTAGWGPPFGGRPIDFWVLPYPVILTTAPRFGIQTNRFGFIISWATNVPVVVEACTSLANPAWSPVATNTLAGGWSYFSDAAWTKYPARFYRVRSP